MRVENPRYNNPLHEAFFQAARQAGIPENTNFNDWRTNQVHLPRIALHCLCTLVHSWAQHEVGDGIDKPGYGSYYNSIILTAFRQTMLLGWTWSMVASRANRTCLALQEGYGEFQVTHSKGERADCFRMYLKPILGRSNLTVLTDAKTLKVETEEAAGTTVTKGVTFQQAGPDGSKLQGGLPECITSPLLRTCGDALGCRELLEGVLRAQGFAPNAAALDSPISFALVWEKVAPAGRCQPCCK